MSDRKEFRDLVTPETAREAIASLSIGGDTESVPLREARGRVLAERIDAEIDVPGFDRASMDGYAVQAKDTFGADEADPVELELAGAVHAGEAPAVSVAPGTAVEISTGAVLPKGADAVVMVERTDEVDGGVAVRKAVAPGDNVMPAGTDVAAGERALGPKTRVTPREIGLLAALGVDAVPVAARPRVGIISTGDELVRPGESLDPGAGQIFDVNSYSVAAGVEDAGGTAVLYPHAGDDYDEMERLLLEAAEECDLVLSSGSTSASAVDVIYRVIEETGDLLVHGVAVKPGKPMLVGRIGDTGYVGLPGYPVSALTIFRTFVAPAIRDAAGVPEPATATVTGEMATEARFDQGRMRLLPVGLVETGDGLLAYPVDKGSGATTSLVESDGFVQVAPDTAFVGAGEAVEVTLFSPDVEPPTIVGMGEDDPVLSRALDEIEGARYLRVGGRNGLRGLRDGIADFAVTTGTAPDSLDVDHLGSWRRNWGLVVPPGNPADVVSVSSLCDQDLSFVNLSRDAGLRGAFDETIDTLADYAGTDRDEIIANITGYDRALPAHESPARAVARGAADVGLGLESTADALGLGFVGLGEQTVTVYGNPARRDKPAMSVLRRVLDGEAEPGSRDEP